MSIIEGWRIVKKCEFSHEHQRVIRHGLRNCIKAAVDKPSVKAQWFIAYIDNTIAKGRKRNKIACIERLGRVVFKAGVCILNQCCIGFVGQRIGHVKTLVFVQLGADDDVILAHNGVGPASVLLPLDERVAVNGRRIEQLNVFAFGQLNRLVNLVQNHEGDAVFRGCCRRSRGCPQSRQCEVVCRHSRRHIFPACKDIAVAGGGRQADERLTILKGERVARRTAVGVKENLVAVDLPQSRQGDVACGHGRRHIFPADEGIAIARGRGETVGLDGRAEFEGNRVARRTAVGVKGKRERRFGRGLFGRLHGRCGSRRRCGCCRRRRCGCCRRGGGRRRGRRRSRRRRRGRSRRRRCGAARPLSRQRDIAAWHIARHTAAVIGPAEEIVAVARQPWQSRDARACLEPPPAKGSPFIARIHIEGIDRFWRDDWRPLGGGRHVAGRHNGELTEVRAARRGESPPRKGVAVEGRGGQAQRRAFLVGLGEKDVAKAVQRGQRMRRLGDGFARHLESHAHGGDVAVARLGGMGDGEHHDVHAPLAAARHIDSIAR